MIPEWIIWQVNRRDGPKNRGRIWAWAMCGLGKERFILTETIHYARFIQRISAEWTNHSQTIPHLFLNPFEQTKPKRNSLTKKINKIIIILIYTLGHRTFYHTVSSVTCVTTSQRNIPEQKLGSVCELSTITSSFEWWMNWVAEPFRGQAFSLLILIFRTIPHSLIPQCIKTHKKVSCKSIFSSSGCEPWCPCCPGTSGEDGWRNGA